MFKKFFLYIIVAVFVLNFSACSTNEPKANKSKHSIKSKELKQVMLKLDSIVNYKIYSSVEKNMLRLKYSKELSAITDELTNDIKRIKDSSKELNLGENAQEVFLMLALELEKESKNLKKVSTLHDVDQIKPALDRMMLVCNKCHHRYRK